MFLLIDNYDSFTYNLVQAFASLGREPLVVKNDDPWLLELAESPELRMVCISPGPGHPDDAGLCPEFLNRLDPSVPVLGVCLGHQLLARHAGAEVVVAPVIMHGKQSEIRHNEEGLFKGSPNPLNVGRYHSLVAIRTPETDARFTVTATGPHGEIMALRYNDRPWVGVQFHPESVLTPEGIKLLGRFPEEIVDQKAGKTQFSHILDELAEGRDLSEEMASAAFSALLGGQLNPAQASALLMGLRVKGESPVELACAARAALSRSRSVPGLAGDCIDVVGTGGDGRDSFNCSTATSLILAGLGYRVVKHGNRSVSSKCGSADALEGLDIPLENDPAKIVKMLEKRNFAFIFAPYFHPGFKNVGPIRKDLGIRTLFNILGPMINPARPSHLLMGVARPEMVDLVAKTLARTGLRRGAVVCGAGGYDELTPIGAADVALLRDGHISSLTVDPARYGMAPCEPEDLAVHDRETAIATLKKLLAGQGPKAMLDMLTLNVGLAIYLLEDDFSLDQAMEKAGKAVRSGAGARTVENA